MNKIIPAQVLEVFFAGFPVNEISIEKIGGGLINRSYKITTPDKSVFLLQQVNKHVFSNPADVQKNYVTIYHYAKSIFNGPQLPAPKHCSENTSLFLDRNKNYWRACEFIDNADTLLIATESRQAKATASAFAKFTAAFAGFKIELLKNVIPDFHNLSYRYQQFKESLNTISHERLERDLTLINELKQREKYKHFYETIIKSEEFPQRVMHHDAKIANILFNKENGEVICPVDFDTVMPGYIFSDLGDIIRSMACSHDENSISFDNISIRKHFYAAIVKGYIEVLENQLTKSEIENIHSAGLLMTYMQALRFFSDYLNGDIYYRTEYPEQNFNRAKNQLVLLKKLEEFLKAEYNFSV